MSEGFCSLSNSFASGHSSSILDSFAFFERGMEYILPIINGAIRSFLGIIRLVCLLDLFFSCSGRSIFP